MKLCFFKKLIWVTAVKVFLAGIFLLDVGFVYARVNNPSFAEGSPNIGTFRKKAEKNLMQEEEVISGFLAISLIGRGEFGLHRSLQKSNYPSIFSLGILIEGGAPDFQVDSRITLLHDMIHVADYFTGKAKSFTNNQLYSYSFFNMASSYRIAGKKNIFFHLGFALGHQGFLHQSLKKPAYTISPSASIGIRWFLGKKVLLRLQAEVLIPIININAKAFLVQTNRLEFAFATKGNIRKPPQRSILITLEIANINAVVYFKNSPSLEKFTVVPSVRISYLF